VSDSPTPGDALLSLSQSARRELLLVAPFMKAGPLERLLDSADARVDPVCITRWRPSEIAAGVSDLDVYGVLAERSGALWLRQDLHAKYFRGDDTVLVGSANLTGAALGWSVDPNLEILVTVDRFSKEVVDFERVAMQGAVKVDQDLHETFAAAAKCWSVSGRLHDIELQRLDQEIAIETEFWLPALRNPAELYFVYQLVNSHGLPIATREAAMRDLAVLQPPPGLSKEDFGRAIGAVLLSIPVVNSIDRFVVVPQRFGAVRNLLKDHLELSHAEATRVWQTLIRWLRHFLPNRYEYSRPRYSEIMVRVDRAERGSA